MKKLFVGVAMVLVLGLVANVAFTDEIVPFPLWQHGWAIMSFWSVSNNAASGSATVTINLLKANGTLWFSTTGTVVAGQAWQPSTAEAWYTAGNGVGFGNYTIVSTTDSVYLWGAVYASLSNMQPGYTVILPQNPYGVP